MDVVHDPYGLDMHTLYRIPGVSVSYDPKLADRRVFWTGHKKVLPQGGGTFYEFRFADKRFAHEEATWWLRPYTVVKFFKPFFE